MLSLGYFHLSSSRGNPDQVHTGGRLIVRDKLREQASNERLLGSDLLVGGLGPATWVWILSKRLTR